jgi:hypothetical protein
MTGESVCSYLLGLRGHLSSALGGLVHMLGSVWNRWKTRAMIPCAVEMPARLGFQFRSKTHADKLVSEGLNLIYNARPMESNKLVNERAQDSQPRLYTRV